MACIADINVLQGSVATYSTCGGTRGSCVSCAFGVYNGQVPEIKLMIKEVRGGPMFR